MCLEPLSKVTGLINGRIQWGSSADVSSSDVGTNPFWKVYQRKQITSVEAKHRIPHFSLTCFFSVNGAFLSPMGFLRAKMAVRPIWERVWGWSSMCPKRLNQEATRPTNRCAIRCLSTSWQIRVCPTNDPKAIDGCKSTKFQSVRMSSRPLDHTHERAAFSGCAWSWF